MSLPDNLNWLLRPWIEGKIQYYELDDGTYDLADIAEMNEALDVQAENIWRANEAATRK